MNSTPTPISNSTASKLRPWAALLALAIAAACAEPEKEKLPLVTTSGPHAVAVGATIQIVPATSNGTDRSYSFTSGAPSIASVDSLGKVTGVAPGETAITVAGQDTMAAFVHPVVVIAAEAVPPPDAGSPDATTDTELPTPVPADQVPFFAAWLGSAHADPTAPAFTNWNKEGTIPATCARCHSSPGFVDYLGGDGSVPGVVDRAAPTGTVVSCTTCHAAAAETLTSITFPSGAEVEGLGREATCMTCHQGRASGADVDKVIAAAGTTGEDTPSPMISFTNIHYYPAAATLYAGRAKGGYQYPGQVYDTRFRHVDGFNTCTGCHDAHSTKPKVAACATCHTGVKSLLDLREVRMMSSANRDYDGDGDVAEGVAHELDGLKDKLLASMRRYGVEKQAPLCYSSTAYPYWFNDGNGDGLCGADEAQAANAYKSWTPRLAKAAFNYQLANKDPGAFAHNAKYIMQLLFDSTTAVNAALVVKVDMSQAVRGDRGHFNGASEAARHWDSGEKVDATCSRCHGGQSGFRFFVEHNATIEVPETGNGLECGTCHTSFGKTFDVLAVKNTSFPGGITSALPGNDNLCGNCHSGRVAKADIDRAIAANQLGFQNVHYLPAAATRQGNAAKVGYEYDGKAYAGPLKHTGGVQCTSCHSPIASQHSFLVADAFPTTCRNCHADANGNADAIRLVRVLDYDGDGNVSEPLRDELRGLGDRLLVAMGASAAGGLCYAEAVYPYFFKDADGDHKPQCAPAEAVAAGKFAAWTPALMKAAHNYQLTRKDPGAWAHNFDYAAQLLYDSIEASGGDVTSLRRPAAP
jgi:predicted CXXCH cytochrome family protein